MKTIEDKDIFGFDLNEENSDETVEETTEETVDEENTTEATSEEETSSEEVDTESGVSGEIETSEEEESAEGGEEEATEGEEEGEGEEVEIDYTYKVNGVVKELPDFIKEKITSPEEAAVFKELYEKAEGLDIVKSHRDRLLQENNEYKSKIEEVQNLLDIAQELKTKNDIIGALRIFGFTDQDIVNAASVLVGSPEDKQKYELYSESLRRQILAEREALKKAQTIQQQEVEVAKQMLELKLQQPEIKEVAELYDRYAGQGAFVRNVIMYGESNERLGRVVSIDEAVNYALQIAKPLVENLRRTKTAGKIRRSQEMNEEASASKPAVKKIKKRIKAKGSNPVGKKVYRNIFEMEEAGLI